MVEKVEAAGGSHLWREWYPRKVVPDFTKISLTESPYGLPNLETLLLFASLPLGSRIGDIGGGDGRYAVPLARMGHRVVMPDVDFPHMRRTQEKSILYGVKRRVTPVYADATGTFPIKDGSLDAVLNAGFGYLIPPDQLETLFGKMTKTLRKGGSMVFEFATNRKREDKGGHSLIGDNEYNYKHEEGMAVLKKLYAQYGFEEPKIQGKTIDFKEPYIFHTDLIIASATKK